MTTAKNDNLVFNNGSYVWTRFPPLSTETTYNRFKLERKEVRETVSTPGYRKKVVKGRVSFPENPFFYLKQERKALSSDYRMNGVKGGPREGWYQIYTGDILLTAYDNALLKVGPADTASDRTRLNDQAALKLLSTVKNQKINFAQFFAERSQVANMFASTAVRIADCLAALKRGQYAQAAHELGVLPHPRAQRRYSKSLKPRGPSDNRSLAKRQVDSMSTGWLELQYGWKPLITDLYGACDLLASLQVEPPVFKAVGRSSFTNKNTSSFSQTSPNYGPVACIVHREGKSTVKYTAYYQVKQGVASTLSQIGITNPFLIAWELMPWSFVIDWFIPIGTWIGSFDTELSVNFLKGSKTEFYRYDNSMVNSQTNVNAFDYIRNGDLAKQTFSSVECRRTKLTQLPYVMLPRFKNPVSVTHAVNAMALLNNLHRK